MVSYSKAAMERAMKVQGSNFASRGEEDHGGDAEFLLRESGSD